jgi:hypothetical protein
LQHDLGEMHPTPIISMSAYQVERRQRWHDGRLKKEIAEKALLERNIGKPTQGEQHGG